MKKLTILFATILIFTLTMSTFAGAFPDVPQNHWAYDAINELFNAGVVEGYPDGEFKGEQQMTRYEMAVMIARGLENINQKRESAISDLETALEDLEMSLKGTEQLEDLRHNLTTKDIEQLRKDVDEVMAKIKDFDETLGDLDMKYQGLQQLSDLRYSINQRNIEEINTELDQNKEEYNQAIDGLKEQIATVKKAGLNTEQAQDVTAIVRSMIKENNLDQAEVNAKTEEAIKNLQNLINEFDPELDKAQNKMEGLQKLSDLRYSIMTKNVERIDEELDALDERVTAIEEEMPVVKFSGSYGVDFEHIVTSGDPIEGEEGSEYYFHDPYDTNSGDYKSQKDSSTDNDDGTGDYRLTDDGDYYEDDLSFTNTLDLNISVEKGVLSANLDMVAFENEFAGSDTNAYELDSLTGTITAPNMTATIEDGQEVTFTDYMFDGATVDGVVVDYNDDTYFLSRTTETLEESAYDLTGDSSYIVEGDDDDVATYDRNWLHAGAATSFDLLLPMNLYVGYEYSSAIDDDWNDVPAGYSITRDEVNTALVGLNTGTSLAGFDLTADVAFNPMGGEGGYLFQMGATGELSIVDVAFNYENTKDIVLMPGNDITSTEGYDIEVGSSLGFVEGSVYHEAYDGDTETVISLAVPEGELSFAGIKMNGNYELTTDSDDGKNEVRNINASTSLIGIDMTYDYEYEGDNDIYDEPVDMVDDGVDTPGDYEESDSDTNKHTIAGTYNMGDFTAGATAEMEKGIVNDATTITWENSFTSTYTFNLDYASGPITAGLEHVIAGDTTITGRYSQEMYEVGLEKVLGGELTIDGSITAPTLNLMGVAIDSSASFKRELNAENQNVGVNVDASKDVSDNVALTSAFSWADKEIGVDNNGVKKTFNAGVDYTITDDISANADLEYLDFDGDSGVSYSARKATAGVSISF